MSLVPSFVELLQPLPGLMTVPTFSTFMLILTGWTFAVRRTITGTIVAAEAVGQKHHSAFHRVFSASRWSLDQLGLAVFDLLAAWLAGTMLLAVDDTLAGKRGLQVFGVGMHLYPMIFSHGKKLINWGYSWVVLGVLIRFPLWPQRWFWLPILFRLSLNKPAAARHRRVYRTRPELALEMLRLLCRARNSRRFHLVADSAYGGQSVLAGLPENCDLTSRLVLDARLHALPPRESGDLRAQRFGAPAERAGLRVRRAGTTAADRRSRAACEGTAAVACSQNLIHVV